MGTGLVREAVGEGEVAELEPGLGCSRACESVFLVAAFQAQ